MSLLEQFPRDDLEFLVALPYRTGLWVSVCDESGGHEADQTELQVLESIIHGFATDFCKSEITEALMKRTVASRDKWEEWSKDIENVPAECRKGIEFLAQYADHKNVAAFKENLMEIAYAVAMAYREFDDEGVSLVEKITMYWHFISDKVMAIIQHRAPKTHDEIFNISRAERMALTELAEAVQRDRKEGLAVMDVYADENLEPEVLEKIARHKEEERLRQEKLAEEEASMKALHELETSEENNEEHKEYDALTDDPDEFSGEFPGEDDQDDFEEQKTKEDK